MSSWRVGLDLQVVVKPYRRGVGEYRISELAARSGFPASTLRFYEQAGLLPAARSPSGYRLYGDDAVDRLEFVAAAKGLGLTLEDIRELLSVWEHGVCAQVQTRLRPLVATRIEQAQLRIAELSAFVTALAGVHDELGGPAPDGACGPGCGCVSADPLDPARLGLDRTPPPRPSSIGPASMETAAGASAIPIACTLSAGEQVQRRREWAELLGAAITRDDTPDGVRVGFPLDTDLAARLAQLAGAEQDCCAFWEFTLAFTPTTLFMTVTAPLAARPLLAEFFGATT